MPSKAKSLWCLTFLNVALGIFGQNQNSSIVQSSAADKEKFADVVQKNFRQWDSNGDGVLSKDEIEAAAANPKTKGDAAATVATIIHFTRNNKLSLPPLTKNYLTETASYTPSSFNEQSDSVETEADNRPAFQKSFNNYLRKIVQTSRQLFPQKLPLFDAVHQEALGDCPFVSTVGALVYRSPSAVRAMFVKKENGAIIVNFGDGQKLNVHNLTDVDIAIWSAEYGRPNQLLPITNVEEPIFSWIIP